MAQTDQTLKGLLADLRRRRGLTQEQLAARTGISASFISHVEGGSRLPSEKRLNVLIRELAPTTREADQLRRWLAEASPPRERDDAEVLRRLDEIDRQLAGMTAAIEDGVRALQMMLHRLPPPPGPSGGAVPIEELPTGS